MAHGDPLALHVVAPHRRGVQQHVHDVVREQVHLIDVQHAPIGSGQQPRLEHTLTLADRALEAIQQAANTGSIGDGKIFMLDLGAAVRIRTGETGAVAL